MNMKIETNKKTNTKRIGALVATCAALFALTLMVIPAHKALAGGGDTELDYSGYEDYSAPDTSYPDNSYDSYTDYSYDTSYDTPIYGYESTPSYSSPSYNYSTPSYQYSTPSSHYVQSSGCSSCGGSTYQPYQPMTYVPYTQSSATPNTNVNTNSNGQSQSSNNSNKSNSTSVSSNTTSNSGNNVNNNQSSSQSNNNINVVFYNGVATSTYSAQGTVQDQTLNGYCTISPSVVDVNQDVTFIATPTGGNGSYIYNWSGSDGLSSHSQSFTGRFGTIGTKTATLTIQSGNQVITRTCNVQVGGSTYNPYPVYQPTYTSPASNVTVYRQPTQGTPVSGVYLSQVPATGIDFNLKTTLFILGLLMWSAFVAYYMIARRKAQVALATISGSSNVSKAEAFKLANMQKRGLIS